MPQKTYDYPYPKHIDVIAETSIQREREALRDFRANYGTRTLSDVEALANELGVSPVDLARYAKG